MVRNDHRWAFQPVDAGVLFNLLHAHLGVDGRRADLFEPAEIVGIEMPAESDPRFRDKYLLREVLRKYPGFDLGIDTKLAAMSSFFQDEAVNRLTNDRLLSVPPKAVAEVFNLARKKIAEILGPFDESSFRLGWRFGPHSTISLRRSEATVDKKVCLVSPAASIDALPIYESILSDEPFWAYGGVTPGPNGVGSVTKLVKICQFDRWESVPKNAKTDRGIGVPPDVNVLLQLSLGRMMRRALFLHGVNLNDQSINQRAALSGSITGKTATVDVKSASQSVTCGLVWSLIGSQPSRLLDGRWYWMLEKLRTPFTLIDGRLHENELFSAMGNGYTFELESLIFYGLAWACTSYLGADVGAVTVYGDDIILPVEAYALLVEVFDFAGFRINEDKSFSSVSEFRFRESCGKHFLNGIDVTPFYVDKPLDNPGQIILLANNLRRWASNVGISDGRLYPVWLWILSHLGEGYLSCGIPLGEANDGIVMSWDEAVPRAQFLSEKGSAIPTFVGWKAKTVVFEPRPQSIRDAERYVQWMYHASGHTGFKPPPRPVVTGGSWFRGSKDESRPEMAAPVYKVPWSSALGVAPEVPRSKGLKADLHTSSRVVPSWPDPGNWVSDEDGSPMVDTQLHVCLVRGDMQLTKIPPLRRENRDKKKKRKPTKVRKS